MKQYEARPNILGFASCFILALLLIEFGTVTQSLSDHPNRSHHLIRLDSKLFFSFLNISIIPFYRTAIRASVINGT
jgi:hypothetical protein